MITNQYDKSLGIYDASNKDPDYIRGIKILRMYHDFMLNYPSQYKISFDDLIAVFESKFGITKAPIYIEGIGLAANINEMSDSDCEDAMEALADAGQGKIPDNWQAWSNALGEVAKNPGFFKALTFTAVETAKDVGTGFQKLGDTLITTMNIGRYFLPVLILGGAALYVYFRIKPRRI